MNAILSWLKAAAKAAKRDAILLYLAARDPRVPWAAKAVAAAAAAYALSPIDLIPDFIPILGYLDEAILLPIVVGLIMRLIPQDVKADLRVKAETIVERPVSRTGAAIVVVIWGGVALLLLAWLYGD